jgi:hypothetical protein
MALRTIAQSCGPTVSGLALCHFEIVAPFRLAAGGVAQLKLTDPPACPAATIVVKLFDSNTF